MPCGGRAAPLNAPPCACGARHADAAPPHALWLCGQMDPQVFTKLSAPRLTALAPGLSAEQVSALMSVRGELLFANAAFCGAVAGSLLMTSGRCAPVAVRGLGEQTARAMLCGRAAVCLPASS